MELYNIEAEQTLLGSIIINNSWIDRFGDFLEEKHFFEQANQKIYRKIFDNYTNGVVDQITLKTYFENCEEIKTLGGVAYLSTLLARATGIIDLRDYAKEVVELWQKRQLLVLLEKSIMEIGERSFNALAGELENDIVGLAIAEPKKKTQSLDQVIADYEEDVRQGRSSEYVATGFPKLDDLLAGGLYKQEMAIIGARPSVGKSSVAINIMLNASLAGKQCVFFSLEMGKKSVYLKFLSLQAMVNGWKLRKNANLSALEDQDLRTAKQKLVEIGKNGLFINDSSVLRVSQINRLVKSVLDKQPVDLVVVDYVQIVKAEEARGKNEATLIKEITTALKALAKQYNVAVLCLAQINRKAVEGAKQEPTINDFKSSGGIEEDADVAIILHRDRDETKKDGYFSKHGKFIVAKQRNGATGEVNIYFEGEYGKFSEAVGI